MASRFPIILATATLLSMGAASSATTTITSTDEARAAAESRTRALNANEMYLSLTQRMREEPTRPAQAEKGGEGTPHLSGYQPRACGKLP
jgi:hypothetical protein